MTDLERQIVDRLSSIACDSNDAEGYAPAAPVTLDEPCLLAIAREAIRLMEWSRSASPLVLKIDLGSHAPPLTFPPPDWKP